MAKTNPKIIKILSEKLKIRESSVRQYIAGERLKNPGVTLNAAAQLFALSRGVNVLNKLNKEDRITLPNLSFNKAKIIEQKRKRREEIKILIDYNTDDQFKKGHINELHRAYTHHCYTSCFVLCRKIVENLIVDILRSKFPKEKNLFWDNSRGRFLDFSVILKNLYDKRGDFGPERTVIERLNEKIKPFKDDANNKIHSWFHLVESEKELKDININFIIGLIKKIEDSINLKR